MERHQLKVPAGILPERFSGTKSYSFYQQPWNPNCECVASYLVGPTNGGPRGDVIVDQLAAALKETSQRVQIGDVEKQPPLPGLELVFDEADPRLEFLLRAFRDGIALQSQPRRPLYATTGELLNAIRQFSERLGL